MSLIEEAIRLILWHGFCWSMKRYRYRWIKSVRFFGLKWRIQSRRSSLEITVFRTLLDWLIIADHCYVDSRYRSTHGDESWFGKNDSIKLTFLTSQREWLCPRCLLWISKGSEIDYSQLNFNTRRKKLNLRDESSRWTE